MAPLLGRRIARFNRAVTNRVTAPVAPWLPGFGIVEHIGRASGRGYRTPVNVFRHEGCYVIALTYGARADWVRNVEAAGGCGLITRGRHYRLYGPARHPRRGPSPRPRAGACGAARPRRRRVPAFRRDRRACAVTCACLGEAAPDAPRRSITRMPTRS